MLEGTIVPQTLNRLRKIWSSDLGLTAVTSALVRQATPEEKGMPPERKPPQAVDDFNTRFPELYRELLKGSADSQRLGLRYKHDVMVDLLYEAFQKGTNDGLTLVDWVVNIRRIDAFVDRDKQDPPTAAEYESYSRQRLFDLCRG